MDFFAKKFPHPKTAREAVAIQMELAPLVRLSRLPAKLRTIAAVDADYAGPLAFAAAVLYDYPSCSGPLQTRGAVELAEFPYLPGLLSFREAPVALAALEKLSQRPDLILVDGQGIAHPRRFGIACHIGVLTGIPSVGCAKTHLMGDFREPCATRGSWSELKLEGEVVGAVVRTRSGVKPVFVSPGHLVTLEEAIEVVLHCAGAYRIPEPLREADRAAKSERRRRQVS